VVKTLIIDAVEVRLQQPRKPAAPTFVGAVLAFRVDETANFRYDEE